MKFLDKVKVISDKYEKYGIKKGDIGNILLAEIRDGRFFFCKEDPYNPADDIDAAIKIEDLELVKSSDVSDECILNALPKKEWWCKVEDGYILNLKGEKQNKIPYKYDS